MQIINVTQQLIRAVPTNIRSENSILLVETDNAYNYVGLFEYNFNTNETIKFKFEKRPQIITYTTVKRTIYYAYVENNCMKINKVNCKDWTEDSITEISCDNNDGSSGVLNSRMIGLSERYALLAIPYNDLKYGRPFFEGIYLIDAIEKQSYRIQDKIGEKDTLLRLDDAWIVNDGKHLILKTGRISWQEKRRIWEKYVQRGTANNYFDEIENLVAIDVIEFVKKVINGLNFNDSIIQSTDHKTCIRLLENNADMAEDKSGNIIYIVESFNDRTTDFITYNLNNGKVSRKQLDYLYKDIKYYNGTFYSITDEMPYNEVIDIFTNTKVYSFKGQDLKYFSNEIAVISKPNRELHMDEILISNLVNCNEYIVYTNHSLYFSKQDLFLLY